MIKTRKGKVRCNGSMGELLTDLGVIVSALYNEVLLPEVAAEDAKRMILDTVELTMLPEEEIEQRMKDVLFRTLGEVAEKLAAVVEENKKEEDEDGSK